VDPVRFGADALLEPILSLRKAIAAPAPEPRGRPELRCESGRPAGQAGGGGRG